MPKRSQLKISKRSVDALRVEGKDAVFWDCELPGFGVRVHRTGRKTYVVQTRGPSGPKRVTIGRHGDMAAEQARKEAATIIDRIKRGMDPVPAPPVPEFTVADLAERCMSAHVKVNCRPKTVELYRHAIYSYIVPELGSLSIGAVDRAQVTALHYKLRDKPYQANHVLNVLSKLFALAEAWGLAPPGMNPCRGVHMYRKHKRERFLTEDEYRRLGLALFDPCDPPADFDRLPAQRNRHAAVGRCGQDSGRAAVARFQDGRAHDPADADGRRRARRHRARSRQPLGDRRQETGRSSVKRRRGMAASAGAGGAG